MTASTRRTDDVGVPPRAWWRVSLVIVLSLAGAAGAIGCGLAWLLMGFMGTAVAPWEPVAYPAGVVVCVSVPVLVGRVLLGRERAPVRRIVGWMVVALLVAALLAAGVLGATA